MYLVDVFEKSQSASLGCDWHKVAMRRHGRVASEHMVNFIRRKPTLPKPRITDTICMVNPSA